MGAPRTPGEQTTDSSTHELPDTQEQDTGKVDAGTQTTGGAQVTDNDRQTAAGSQTGDQPAAAGTQSRFAYPSLTARIRAEWLIYVVALAFALVASLIGQISIPIGPGQLILFPIFYAIVFGILSGPSVLRIFRAQQVKAASKLVIVAICPFIAKLGIAAGASIETVVSAGPALFSHAFGDILTILVALPVALALGLKRESIGAASSINRETNLAVTTDVYGAESPETRGSLSIYVVGGMLGTIYFGLMASIVAAFHLLHPLSLGLASGVGAGIMMAAAVGSLGEIYPDQADQITALAGASQTIAGIDGVYLAMFVALPLTAFLYRRLEPWFAARRHEPSEVLSSRAAQAAGGAGAAAAGATTRSTDKGAAKGGMRATEWAFLFLIAGVGIVMANFVGFHVSPLDSLPGVAVLLVISLLAMACTRLIPLKLPIVAYASILGLVVAGPWSPIQDVVVNSVNAINLTAPLALVGAFAGIGVADQLGFFAKQGWKMIVVGVVFMTGSFVITGFIAQGLLSLTGTI